MTTAVRILDIDDPTTVIASLQVVIPALTQELVSSSAPLHHIFATTAIDDVTPLSAKKHIDTLLALDHIIGGGAGNRVIEIRSVN